MDGILNIYKTAGPTSHDVVDQVRRLFGQKRVGHTGTLDPMATGVLVVCLGKATRIVEYLVGAPKEYRAEMILGQSTDTQDSTGVIVTESDASGVDMDTLGNKAASFVGKIEQIPPMVSAIKHNGKPLYKLAREGKTIERAAREVTIYSIEVTDFTPGRFAKAKLTVRCSSGTYIRTLCADIGDSLGCGAYMSALERTRVGQFDIKDSVTLEKLQQVKESGNPADFVYDMSDALSDMPAVVLDDTGVKLVMHGIAITSDKMFEEGLTVRMLSASGELIAIGNAGVDGEIKPHKVLAEMEVQS